MDDDPPQEVELPETLTISNDSKKDDEPNLNSSSTLAGETKDTKNSSQNIRRSQRRDVRSIYATRIAPKAPEEQSLAISSHQNENKGGDINVSITEEAPQTSLKETNQQRKSDAPVSYQISKELAKYKVGVLIEARDSAKDWYKSRIVELDNENNRVKVHFLGWNSRFDQWFEAKSNDLKLISSKKSPGSSSSLAKSADESTTLNLSKFEPGCKVMAKWKDEFFYPAQIVRHLMKSEVKYYEIKFYDNVKKLVKIENLRKPTEEELKSGFEETTEIKTSAEITSNESPSTDLPKQNENEEQRRAEAFLLLAIQQPKLNNTTTTAATNLNSTQPPSNLTETTQGPTTPKLDGETAGDSLNKKSLRVKKLRTYTEEIVFDSPSSSIAYNLASVHKQTSVSSDTSSPALPLSGKKNKRILSNVEESGEVAEATTNATKKKENNDKKAEGRDNIKNYFKSLKLFQSKSGKKLASSSLININRKKVVKTKDFVPKKRKSGASEEESRLSPGTKILFDPYGKFFRYFLKPI